MYKLLIVEDSEIERAGIRYLLDDYHFPFEIRETENGRLALSEIINGTFIPDILLTDIRMPVMNGLELAQKVRSRYPNMPIVFFSGYADFEYAKAAIDLKATKYILKPLIPSEFEETMKQLLLFLDQKQQEKTKEDLFENIISTQICHKLITGTPFGAIMSSYSMDQLNFLYLFKNLILIEFDSSFFDKSNEELMLFSKMATEITGGLPVILDSSQAALLINTTRNMQNLKDMCFKLYSMLMEQYHTSCYIALGDPITSPHMVGKAYDSAVSNLSGHFFTPDEHIYGFSKNVNPDFVSYPFENLLEEITNALRLSDMELLTQNIHALLEKCTQATSGSSVYIRYIYSRVLEAFYGQLKNNLDENFLIQALDTVYKTPTIKELHQKLEEMLAMLVSKKQEAVPSAQHSIRMIKEYLNTHYQEDISLDSLSKRFYLSSRYISLLFIRETGIGLSRYIKKLRINKAAELLIHTNMKIHEISSFVGYTNTSYFCRCFRDEFRKTPDAYRQALSASEGEDEN